MSVAKHWTVTLNNYSADEKLVFEKAIEYEEVSYICFQEEIGETTGTPHLQGYISFTKKKRLSGVKKVLGTRIHAVCANGKPSANRRYCSKSETAVEGTFQEFGEIPEDKAGKRSDLDQFIHAVENGLRCKKKARVEFPALVAKYPRWCYDVIDDQKDIQVEEHE